MDIPKVGDFYYHGEYNGHNCFYIRTGLDISEGKFDCKEFLGPWTGWTYVENDYTLVGQCKLIKILFGLD